MSLSGDLMLTVFGTIAGLMVLLIWLVPLVIGVRVYSRNRVGAMILILFSSAWVIACLAAGGGGYFFYHNIIKATMPVDFDPATYEGEMGLLTITPPVSGKLTLCAGGKDEHNRMTAETIEGGNLVPVGSYHTVRLKVEQDDSEGNTWTADYSLNSQIPNGIAVTQDTPAMLPAGPPFTGVLDISQRPDKKLSIALQITDMYGNQTTLNPPNRRSNTPSFEALQDGQVVWSGKMEYG